jgi:hypothetical protein
LHNLIDLERAHELVEQEVALQLAGRSGFPLAIEPAKVRPS